MPTAIAIDPDYSDQLWIKDSRFENVTGPAVLISNENSRMTQINVENIDLPPVCRSSRGSARAEVTGGSRRDLPGEDPLARADARGMGAPGEIEDHLRCRAA